MIRVFAFYQGLSEETKNKVATRDPPRALESLQELACNIDLGLHERRSERSITITICSPNLLDLNHVPTSFHKSGLSRRERVHSVPN